MAMTASTLSTSAQQVLADAVNAETGVRGYAATGNPLFLQPYNLTLARLAEDQAALRAAAAPKGTAARSGPWRRPRPRRWRSWPGCAPRSARAPRSRR